MQFVSSRNCRVFGASLLGTIVLIGMAWSMCRATDASESVEVHEEVGTQKTMELPEQPPENPVAGQLWVDPLLNMRFRYAPPGTFTEGDPRKKSPFSRIRVTITRGFWITENRVNAQQWKALLYSDYSKSKEKYRYKSPPNWWETLKIANRFSSRSSLDPCYELLECTEKSQRIINCTDIRFSGVGCNGYRLPTASEWEWAARAQTDFFFAGSNNLSEVGVYKTNAEKLPNEKRVFKANSWGLRHMSGGSFDWTWNRGGSIGFWSEIDPLGPKYGSNRVVRGGSIHSNAGQCTIFASDAKQPEYQSGDVGFRLIRTVE